MNELEAGVFGPLLGHEQPSGKYGWRCGWHWRKCENNSTTSYTVNGWRFGLCDVHVAAQKERIAVRAALCADEFEFFQDVIDAACVSTRRWARNCRIGVMTITITENNPDAEPRLLELYDLANGLQLLAAEQAEGRWINHCYQPGDQDVVKLQTALAEGSDDYDWDACTWTASCRWPCSARSCTDKGRPEVAKQSSNTWARTAGATLAAIVAGLALAACTSTGGSKAEPTPVPSDAVYTDVTAKFKEALLANDAIKDNSQYEPIVHHTKRAEYSEEHRAYRLHMDVPADDLRLNLWGIAGVGVGMQTCTTLSFYDPNIRFVEVLGSDGKVGLVGDDKKCKLVGN